MAIFIPHGTDYPDGVTQIPSTPPGYGVSTVGTPDPPGKTAIFGAHGQIGESDGGEEFERAEQGTSSHRQIMWYQDAISYIAGLSRGVFAQDSGGNLWRILSSKIRRLGRSAPGYAELSYVEESVSFDVPPDEFSIRRTDLSINILKNPRYFWQIYPTNNNPIFNWDDYAVMVGDPAQSQASVAQVKSAIIRAVQTYQDSPQVPPSNYFQGLIQGDIIKSFQQNIIDYLGVSVDCTKGIGSDAAQLAIAAAGEILQNIWYQEDTPYVPGFEINFAQYFFSTPYLNPGCYVEDPLSVLPDFFTNPLSSQTLIPRADGTGTETPSAPGSATIFDYWPQINPQYFSTTGDRDGKPQYSALRLPDEVDFQRTWFRRSITWYVAPIGHWNPYIFSQGTRVVTPLGYAPLI